MTCAAPRRRALSTVSALALAVAVLPAVPAAASSVTVAPGGPEHGAGPGSAGGFDPERLRRSLDWALRHGVVTASEPDRASPEPAETPAEPSPAVPAVSAEPAAAEMPAPVATAAVAAPAEDACAEPAPWFDIEAWQAQGDLAAAIAFLDDATPSGHQDASARRSALLAKARTYFAAGLAHEALGVLKALPTDDRDADLLRAAAHLLSGRAPGDAAFAPDGTACMDVDTALWWAAADALAGRPAMAVARVSPRAIDRLAAYPVPHRRALGLILAEAALDAGDARRADALIALTAETGPEGEDLGRLLYLKGRLSKDRGDYADAGRSWQEAIGLPGESGLEAVLALGGLPPDAVAGLSGDLPRRLEALMHDWRGHPAAAALPERAIERYLAAGHVDQALAVLARLYADSRNAAQRAELAGQATRLVTAGFEDGDNPQAAIERFWRFESVIAGDAQGNALRLRAARALLDAGLPDAAIDASTTAEGSDRSQAPGLATLRAEAHLAAGRPADALAELAATRGGPTDAHRERELLAARALAYQERFAEAAGLLHERDDLAARSLAADLLWRGRFWSEARDAYRGLLDAPEPPLPADLAATAARRLRRLDAIPAAAAPNDTDPAAQRQGEGKSLRLVAAAEALERRLRARPF
ncbi:hypothetical protein [Marinivivus vitaminiproducens]|uniref:hypothetical protein n=1 Tax=Marinivivus vitaminiproducens TaxID=3035935 RepID=UPI002797FBC7|nr:hypothetical protein P4R82_19365 [Geminicoccaceae bacterium SCSIO 64248]